MTKWWKYLLNSGTLFLVSLWEMALFVPDPFYKKELFITSAVDNIDHNPSATTATILFHGIGISVFQHPLSS